MDTSMVQYILRPKDIQKAASLFELSQEEISKLNSLRILNTQYIRACLMRADFERLTNGLHYLEKADTRYRYPEVLKAIAKEYGTSIKAVSRILHAGNSTMFFCNRCGKRIGKEEYIRGNGICSNCLADTLF